MSGTVEAIYLAESAGAELNPVNEVRALPQKGLEGDRYALGVGSFSRWPGTGRAVTLIESEVIADVQERHALNLSNGRSRRNVVTHGVRLNELVGKRFRIGTALFRAERLAEPCGYLEKRVGEGIQAVLKGRGGLRAEVLIEGVIRVGDPIEVLDGPA
jgi:MOSC domain-containing protein YiiM